MSILKRNRAFLLTAVLIMVVGAALFAGVVAVRVFAAGSTTPTAQPTSPASYNQVSSYGITGYAPLKITPTAQTPSFIKSRLTEKRGIVLLVYCTGAADDEQMLTFFKHIKSEYAADDTFYAFEAAQSGQLGDTLQQLRVNNPPVFAVIRSDGTVAQEYTGWIDEEVMEQVVANAVRGL